MTAAEATPVPIADDQATTEATNNNAIHTISLFVNDKPGVLVRIALVFARRGYNIESLVVSPAAKGGFSRMTITCSGDPDTLEQIIRQLQKLIDVVHAIDHTGAVVIETEIALIKLECRIEDRTQILQIAEQFNARAVDYGGESLVLRIYGVSEKINALVPLLRPYNLTELIRSGKIIMTRGIETT